MYLGFGCVCIVSAHNIDYACFVTYIVLCFNYICVVIVIVHWCCLCVLCLCLLCVFV